MRAKRIQKYWKQAHEDQEQILFSLLYKASQTIFGKYHDFEAIESYDDFAKHVPVASYAELEPLIMRAYHGEKNILRPGTIRLFTESSGTTGTPKILPVTRDVLWNNHFATGQDVLAFFLQQHPQADIFSGKSLSLGGNYRPHPTRSSVVVGNISALLYRYMPAIFTPFRYPSLRIAQIEDRDEKMDLLVKDSYKKDIRVILGIPAWIEMYIRKMEQKYQKPLLEIFPHLSLVLYGGSSLDHYKTYFDKTMGSQVTFLSMYNASEGFFAFQDDEQKDMLLVTWRGIFYEFQEQGTEKIIPLREVELGKKYEMIISTSAGLRRWRIGDVISFTLREPYRIQIVGRTKLRLDKFREDTYAHHIDTTMGMMREQYGDIFGEYSVGYDETFERYVWWIETDKQIDPEKLAASLDKALQSFHRDYREVRQGEWMEMPLVHIFPLGYIIQQMKVQGKVGGQQKVKRIRK